MLPMGGRGDKISPKGMNIQKLCDFFFFFFGWSYDIFQEMHNSVVDYNRMPLKRGFNIVQVTWGPREKMCVSKGPNLT